MSLFNGRRIFNNVFVVHLFLKLGILASNLNYCNYVILLQEKRKARKIIQFCRILGVKSKILTKQSSPTVTIWFSSTYIQLILTILSVCVLYVCWLAILKIKISIQIFSFISENYLFKSQYLTKPSWPAEISAGCFSSLFNNIHWILSILKQN